MDFFNGTNDFGKLIIKELVDICERGNKRVCEKLGILSILEVDGEALATF